MAKTAIIQPHGSALSSCWIEGFVNSEVIGARVVLSIICQPSPSPFVEPTPSSARPNETFGPRSLDRDPIYNGGTITLDKDNLISIYKIKGDMKCSAVRLITPRTVYAGVV